ncbi:hypothetical protein SLA2020_440980 [Shorea laevis]
MEDFCTALDDCQFSDLDFSGSKFTWCNYREDSSFMKECLDPAVANPSWCVQFQDVAVTVMATQNSDHCPYYFPMATEARRILGAVITLNLRSAGCK